MVYILYTALVLIRIYSRQFLESRLQMIWALDWSGTCQTTRLKSVVICACVYLMYTTDLDLIINMHTIMIANNNTI